MAKLARPLALPSLAAVALLLGLPPAEAPGQERYDVVLEGGRVMDPETGFDAVGNVGIRGQAVEIITDRPLRGDVVVDASGLVVAPGFIDLHSHGQNNRTNEFQARDGVTTALELESGVPDMAAYLDGRRGDAVLNFGASASHGTARTWVMPRYADRIAEARRILDREGAPSDEELERLDELLSVGNYDSLPRERYGALTARLREEMNRGALGIGMAHQYYPGADREEIFRVFRFAGEERFPIYTHVRSMGVDAVQEVIANAAATGAPLHIVHLNSSSLGAIDTNLDLVEGARDAGVDVTTEAYPYTAASTSLQSAIFDRGWRELLGIDYGDLQWQDTGERLTESTFRSYREEGGVVIIHMMKPEWIARAMAHPDVMVASDAMWYAPGAHPRTAGTFSRFLGRYVREQNLMSLMEGLRKITLMPAERLAGISPRMRRKGRLQVGSDADITVFDPARIVDTATFAEDLSYSRGVVHVLVNGRFVVRDEELVEGARPGKAVVGRLVVF